LYFHQKFIGQLEAPFISKKNLLNSLGAILGAQQAGVSFSQSLKYLKNLFYLRDVLRLLEKRNRF